MKRDTRLIVNKLHSRYDILLTVPLDRPKLHYALSPYGGERFFLCDIAGNETVVADPCPGRRPYFVVTSQGAPEIVAADRLVDVAGVENFREQGGYRSRDGKIVRWGRFFRGGAFARLDGDGKATLDSMGFRDIFDYRDDAERDQQPDYVPKGAAHHTTPAIRPEHADSGGSLAAKAAVGMEERMRLITTEDMAREAFREFQMLYGALPFGNPAYQAMLDALDQEDAVLYQHCSAGKDRTGVGCALLLLALGVDRGTVMGDYCLSAMYREAVNQVYLDKIRASIGETPAIGLLKRMLSVEESLLQASFDAIDKAYPSVEAFLAEEYGVTPERLEHWRSIHLV